MRDYLYVWHRPATNELIVSGIEFRDMLPELAPTSGLVLLRHEFDAASVDPATRLEFVPRDGLAELVEDDIYAYGDFCWCDFEPELEFATLTDSSMAELLFFAHTGRPLHAVAIPGVGNRLLCWGHDDGWYTSLYYRDWNDVAGLLNRVLLPTAADDSARTFDLLRRQDAAVWCRRGTVVDAARTRDIDALMRIHRSKT